jgi:lycopene cyclase domain-containing protein
MDQYLYLAINLASISVPFLASFYPKHPFYKCWKNYFIANLIVATFFIIWDIIFTNNGVWGFNERYLLNYKFINIPFEEVLFFFCIPYASVFVYFSLNYLIKKNLLKNSQRFITLFLVISLVFVGLFFYDKIYTFTTFILTALFLFYNFIKKNDLSKIYFSYFVTLLFFFIVNGILTGSFIDEPVVWYNNEENLGIRMGTIPIEDTFYGFLLIASTIQIFEYINTKSKKNIKY